MSNFLLVDEGGNIGPMVSFGEVSARIAMAQRYAPRQDHHGREIARYDAWAVEELEAYIGNQFTDLRHRSDDFAASLGGGLSPRDLAHRMARVLETPMQPMTSEQAFPANPEIQPGAMSWEQRRLYEAGEAFVYRGGTGSDVVPVALGGATATGKVQYLISKATMNWLEDLALNRVGQGLDTRARKMRVARDVIRKLINRWMWQGASEHGIFGAYNNPYLDTALSAVSYVAATAPDDVVADFSYWANYAESESGSVYQPNQVAIAPKMRIFLQTTPYGDNRDKTIWDFIMSANPHITRVISSPELNDIGGDGIHGMLFSKVGAGPTDSSIEMLTVMPPTMLPPDQRALGSDFYMVGATGGLHQTSAGDNLFVLVQGS